MRRPSNPKERSQDPPSGAEHRMFGTGTLVTYYVTNLVGAGILVVPAIALDVAGPWSILSWMVLSVAAWPMARVFAAIAIDYPDPNGILRFNGEMLGGRLRDSLTITFLVAMVVGNPIVALVGARYLLNGLGWSGAWYQPTVIVLMLANVGFNLLGLKMSSQVQRILLGLTAGALLLAIASAVPAADAGRLLATPFALDGFMVAMAVSFFTFLGWENVCTISPNVRDAEQSFRRAIAIAVFSVGALYIGIGVVLALTVSANTIGGDYAVLNLLAEAGGSATLATTANLIGFLVIFLSGNAWVLAGGKLCSAAARDGLLPSFIALGAEETPRRGVLAMGVMYTVVLLVVFALDHDESVIVGFVSAIFICVYLVTMYAAWRHYSSGKVRRFAWASLLIIGVFALTALLKVILVTVVLLIVYSLLGIRLKRPIWSGGLG